MARIGIETVIWGLLAAVVIVLGIFFLKPVRELATGIIDYNPTEDLIGTDLTDAELVVVQEKALTKFIKQYQECKNSVAVMCRCFMRLDVPKGNLLFLENNGGTTTAHIQKGGVVYDPESMDPPEFETEQQQIQRAQIENDEIYVFNHGVILPREKGWEIFRDKSIASYGFNPGDNYVSTSKIVSDGKIFPGYDIQGRDWYWFMDIYKENERKMAFVPRFSGSDETITECSKQQRIEERV